MTKMSLRIAVVGLSLALLVGNALAGVTAPRDQHTGMPSGQSSAITSPRDAQSGLPTGK
ncbi:MAG TPA: hypothetical protein VFO41_02330 [Alphaproteobacteria bacterium]|nr:hypothetical protein [Alphaproteobacteria bacterium]